MTTQTQEEKSWNLGWWEDRTQKIGTSFSTYDYKDISVTDDIETLIKWGKTIENYIDVIEQETIDSYVKKLKEIDFKTVCKLPRIVYVIIFEEVEKRIKEKTGKTPDVIVQEVRKRCRDKIKRRLIGVEIATDHETSVSYVSSSGFPMIDPDDYKVCRPSRLEELCFILTGSYFVISGKITKFVLSH